MMKISFFRDLFFVPKCVGCGKRFDILSERDGGREAYCDECRAAYEREKLESCSGCGVAAIECTCAPKPLEKKYIDCISLVKFGRSMCVDRLIYALKKRRNDKNFEFVSDELAKRFLSFSYQSGVEPTAVMFTSVPRKESSIDKYGFDHAERLARMTAGKLDSEYSELLIRVSDGKDQKKLDLGKRQKNVMGRFAIAPSVDIDGRTVVLVDDVVTTGSTASECIKALRDAGAAKIILLSISRSAPKAVARRKSPTRKSKNV